MPKFISKEIFENTGISSEDSLKLAEAARKIQEKYPEAEEHAHKQFLMWQEFQKILNSNLGENFGPHKILFDVAFSERRKENPPPAWIPSKEYTAESNIGKIVNEKEFASYKEFHEWSVRNRGDFWNLIINKLGIVFRKKPNSIVNLEKGLSQPEWLPGAEMNIVDSCFKADREKTAIVWQKDCFQQISYGELQELVNRIANGLKELGFQKGDSIGICMPMTAESVATYLAIIKAGCCVVSIADSFAPNEIETRLRICKAKGIFTMDFQMRSGKRLELYSKIKDANSPKAIVIPYGKGVEDLREQDISWENFLSNNKEFESAQMKPGEHTNILFSSGTTGEPKAIPWTHTTPIKCASDAYFHVNVKENSCLAWPTNLGWMMGPWLIYASLMNKAKMALYYGAPTEREFGEFVSKAGVTVLGVVPSLVRDWKERNVMKGIDWKRIEVFASTGECSNKEDMLFLMHLAGYKPIIEYCGGTEIGGAHITGTVVQECSPSTFSTPALGLDFVILDEKGNQSDKGELYLIPPSMGLSNELLNRDHYKVYFGGCPKGPHEELLRRHGEEVERLPNGYFRAHGRVDDSMNINGIKVSSAQIERTLALNPLVKETAAIAVEPENGGPSKLVIYAVLSEKSNVEKEQLQQELQKTIKERLNPLFRIHDVQLIESLPRTASNKVMRRVLREKYKPIKK